MEQTRIWSRVSRFFKSTGGDEQSADASGPLHLTPPGGEGSSQRQSDVTVAAPPVRRGASVDRLEVGYSQLAGVVDKIRDHLQVQDERTERMTDAVSQLAQTVSKFPEAAETQSRQLGNIAEKLQSINERAARWDQAASQIPRLAEAQHDTLRALRTQIDASAKSHEQIVRTMTGLHEAVGSLTRASEASADSLKFLQLSSATRDDHLIKVLTEQHQRFNRLFVVALILASVLTAALAVSLFLK